MDVTEETGPEDEMLVVSPDKEVVDPVSDGEVEELASLGL